MTTPKEAVLWILLSPLILVGVFVIALFSAVQWAVQRAWAHRGRWAPWLPLGEKGNRLVTLLFTVVLVYFAYRAITQLEYVLLTSPPADETVIDEIRVSAVDVRSYARCEVALIRRDEGKPIAVAEALPVCWSARKLGLSDGEYAVVVRIWPEMPFAVFPAQVTTVRFDIDGTPPAVRFMYPEESHAVRGAFEALLQVEGGTLASVSLDSTLLPFGQSGDTYRVYVGSRDVEDGLHYLSARAVDQAGNSGETRIQVTVDNTEPTIERILPQDPPTLGRDSILTAVVEDSTEVSVQWELGEELVTVGNPAGWDTSTVDTGLYPLRVTATDLAGNQSTHATTAQVDNSPPVANWWYKGTRLLALDPRVPLWVDAVSRETDTVFEYSVDGVKVGGPVISLSDKEEGERFLLSFAAVDRAGNESNPIDRAFTVQREIRALANSVGMWAASSIAFAGRAIARFARNVLNTFPPGGALLMDVAPADDDGPVPWFALRVGILDFYFASERAGRSGYACRFPLTVFEDATTVFDSLGESPGSAGSGFTPICEVGHMRRDAGSSSGGSQLTWLLVGDRFESTLRLFDGVWLTYAQDFGLKLTNVVTYGSVMGSAVVLAPSFQATVLLRAEPIP